MRSSQPATSHHGRRNVSGVCDGISRKINNVENASDQRRASQWLSVWWGSGRSVLCRTYSVNGGGGETHWHDTQRFILMK